MVSFYHHTLPVGQNTSSQDRAGQKVKKKDDDEDDDEGGGGDIEAVKKETHRVGRIGEETWLLGNINQTGYFRVNYDLHNWRLLIQQLMTNPTIISVENRAGLVDDVFSLSSETILQSSGFSSAHQLSVCRSSESLWRAGAREDGIDASTDPSVRALHLVGTELEVLLKRFLRAGYLPQNLPLQIICYLSKEDDFLPWHAASRALFQLDKLLDRTEDYSLFSQVELKYHKLDWPRVKTDDSFKQSTYHTELLNASLNSDLLPDQDVIDVIIHVGRNPHARHLAWRYFREKWNELNSRHKHLSLPPVNIQGKDIERLDSYKYLGVHLNNKLDWTDDTTSTTYSLINALLIKAAISNFTMNVFTDEDEEVEAVFFPADAE
ncbi:hypothetical protein QTP86_013295 [Hemibagrus guttatus]|nr:hypothetical protein QTP86_013295 [Hemibagrus guttatus]